MNSWLSPTSDKGVSNFELPVGPLDKFQFLSKFMEIIFITNGTLSDQAEFNQ